MAAAMHPLAQYLESNGETQRAFAKRAGVDRSVINKVLQGHRRRFSADAAMAIESATNGVVSLKIILTWRPPTAGPGINRKPFARVR